MKQEDMRILEAQETARLVVNTTEQTNLPAVVQPSTELATTEVDAPNGATPAPIKGRFADFVSSVAVGFGAVTAIYLLAMLFAVGSGTNPLANGYWFLYTLFTWATWIAIGAYYFYEPLSERIRVELERPHKAALERTLPRIESLKAELSEIRNEYDDFLVGSPADEKAHQLQTGRYLDLVQSTTSDILLAEVWLAQYKHDESMSCLRSAALSIGRLKASGLSLKQLCSKHPQQH